MDLSARVSETVESSPEDNAPSQTVANEDEQQFEKLLLTSLSYEVEETGQLVNTPIIHMRGRTADGDARHVEVIGYRPYLGIRLSALREHLTDITTDRRVMGVVANCEPDQWTGTLDLPTDTPSTVSPEDIAVTLTQTTGAEVYHEPEPFESISGDELVRVYAREPGEIGGADSLRETFEDIGIETFEADIPFERRFAIGTEIYRGVAVPRGQKRIRYENWPGETAVTGSDGVTASVDIEDRDYEKCQQLAPVVAPDVSARMIVYDIEVATLGGGFPDPVKARNPITAITAYDSYDDEYRFWGLINDEWKDSAKTCAKGVVDSCRSRSGFPDDTTVTDPELASVDLYYDETNLLESFHDYVLAREPDILTGWNASGQGGGFDTPYLIQRSYNVNALQIKQYSRTGEPGVWRDNYGGDDSHDFVLQDIVTLDLYDAYIKTEYRELDSYGLGDVAEKEVGFGKTGLKHDELDEAWKEYPVEFFTYNIRDTQATAAIERECGLISLFEKLREVTGASYGTAVNNGPMLDTMFLHRAYEKRLILPTNTEPDEGVFHGAKVFDSIDGVHKNAVYPDLSSLYPSLFSMLNLGEETIIGDETALADSQYTAADCYQFPVDNRPFATVEKGNSIDHIDRDAYKGIKTPAGGVREMFEPQHDWLYVLKPSIKESFVTDIINDLIELKNEYEGDMYSAVKRVTNCFTPDTEVVTPDGIVNIRDLSVGDTVYSFDPETDAVELQPVTETWAYPDYDDELVDIETQKIDFSVTPNHDMIVKRSRYTEEYERVEAGALNRATNYEMPHHWAPITGERLESVDLTEFRSPDEYEVWLQTNVHGRTFQAEIDWTATRQKKQIDGEGVNGYRLSGAVYEEHAEYIESVADGTIYVHSERGQKWVPKDYDGDNIIELCGWFITEGSTHTSEQMDYGYTTRGITHKVTISQYAGANADRIGRLLTDMGIDYYSGERSFEFVSELWVDILSELCGTGSQQKRIPDFIWGVSTEQKELLFDTLIAGDGDSDPEASRYSTQSTQLRDDVIELCTHLGMNAQYQWSNTGDVWRLYYGDTKNTFRMHRSGTRRSADDGVYCVTVADNNTLLAGRNGKFQFVGQSSYGVLGDSASAGGLGSRLYKREVAEGITLAGRLTIEHTAETFTQYLKDNYDEEAYLVGGDTDSSVTAMPSAPTLEHAREWAEEATSVVDETYDTFVQETFGFASDDEHRLHVELESLASKLFYPLGDTEQRYIQQDGGLLERITERDSIKKRYAQHIVWDDDDGWIDIDSDDVPLHDPADKSQLKKCPTVVYETYESGPLENQDPADNVTITGFEYVRSDSAQITREAQERVLTMALLSGEPENRIEEYLKTLVDNIENGHVDTADLGRPKGVGNALDSYGWREYDELVADKKTQTAKQNGGRYVQTPSPTYRGAKYATEYLPWEDVDEGSKPYKYPVDTIRPGASPDLELPEAYEYQSFPEDNRPDSPEVGNPVDAIAVEYPERLPSAISIDTDTIIEKELEEKLESILSALNMDWDEIQAESDQVTLGAFA